MESSWQCGPGCCPSSSVKAESHSFWALANRNCLRERTSTEQIPPLTALSACTSDAPCQVSDIAKSATNVTLQPLPHHRSNESHILHHIFYTMPGRPLSGKHAFPVIEEYEISSDCCYVQEFFTTVGRISLPRTIFLSTRLLGSDT